MIKTKGKWNKKSKGENMKYLLATTNKAKIKYYEIKLKLAQLLGGLR